TRRRIEPLLVGRTIERVHTTKPSYFFLTAPALLKKKLIGRTPLALERWGKYLIARLDDESRLLLHLGMTGQLFSSQATSPRLFSVKQKGALAPELQPDFRPDEHTHLRLCFADGAPDVLFRDVRKFGKCRYLRPGQNDPRLDKLGPDTLTAGGDVLFEATRKRSIPIKSLLLDQSVLAGVGNIYADEALHIAAVRPTRRASRVSRQECQAIMAALRQVMLRSIETGGSSISDYVQPDGSDGGYQDERRVYARTGAPCFNCAQPIRRIVLGQRSAHYCAQCQL
ncbi:MAG TPA: bifunctional DNA-formamidopyrimidine glycosylase/DNA-(apurinic or apyrimidinic site) lyase, partial [Polyangiaceae bacterium]|nr:bifunctional DNA-formamidopyrimidine glycosylase/DNA-(apurinic or apyrimidinic site) lyase [Polyangiaceae bacterium]